MKIFYFFIALFYGTTICAQDFIEHSTTGSNMFTLSIDDMNGDGYPDIIGTLDRDIVLATSNGQVPIDFTKEVLSFDFEIFSFVATGDVDGDGDNDIIVAEEETFEIYGLYNDGQANFSSVALNISGSDFLKLGDVDNDGDLDIVGFNLNSDRIEVYYNNGAQGFQASDVSTTPEFIERLVVEDINNDGNDDIVVALKPLFEFDGEIRAFLSNGNSFEEKEISNGTFGTATKDVAVADINNDGKMDIVAITEYDCRAWINEDNQNYNPTGPLFDSPTNANFISLTLDDMNGDDKIDIVIGDQSSGIIWNENLGNNEFVTKMVGQLSPSFFLLSEDLDLDGDIDVIASNAVLTWYENMVSTDVNTLDFGNSAIEFYPNPSRGIININSGESLEDFIVTVYNINGKKLVNQKISNSYLDISTLDNGHYFLSVTEIKTGKTKTTKITKVD